MNQDSWVEDFTKIARLLQAWATADVIECLFSSPSSPHLNGSLLVKARIHAAVCDVLVFHILKSLWVYSCMYCLAWPLRIVSSDWLDVVPSLHTTGSGCAALCLCVTGLWLLLFGVVKTNLFHQCPLKISIQEPYNTYVLISGKWLW